MWRRASYLCLVLSLVACASARSGAPPAFANAARNVLTAAEIVASRVTDAYQAVSQLRPEFLRRRPSMPMPNPGWDDATTVYLDNVPFGPLESLRAIPLDRVRLIRYLTATEADLRLGGQHPMGAILVTTLR